MGLKLNNKEKVGSFECQLLELQKYSLDELITFIYDKLKNHQEIRLTVVQMFLLQQILFDQMHRVTQE